MALLFFDGFSDTTTLTKPEWNGAFASAVGRNGTTAGGGTVTTLTRDLTLSSTAATCILGYAYVSTAVASGNANQFMSLRDTADTVQLVLFINTSGFIEIRRTSATGTLLGTSSGHTPLANNIWAHIQWKATLHTSTGISTVKLNDVTVLTLTGLASSSLISNVKSVRYAGLSSGTIDDLYVCDATDGTVAQGRTNDDFLGDLRVQQHYPIGAGDSTQWTPSTGNNWAAVDEVPPSTTDYVSDSVSGHRDLYTITQFAGSPTSIYGIRETIYVSKTDGGPTTLKPLIKENSTVTSESAQGLSTTAAGVHGPFKFLKPSNSTVFTASDVNAMQIGVEVG